MRDDVIYRVIYGPTSHAYVYSFDGVGAVWYDTFKQAVRDVGEMPLEIITYQEFESLRV